MSNARMEVMVGGEKVKVEMTSRQASNFVEALSRHAGEEALSAALTEVLGSSWQNRSETICPQAN